MEEHKIAIISDTHGRLRPEVCEKLKECEYIFHAGDIGNGKAYNSLLEYDKLFAVKGNADEKWVKDLQVNSENYLPKHLWVELYGFKFFMVHNKKDFPPNVLDADFVIFGHSHKYTLMRHGKTTFLNPGSCGVKRFNLPLTFCVLTLNTELHNFSVEKIEIICSNTNKNTKTKKMDKLVNKIVNEINAGKAVEEIAAKNGIEKELAEQICRIYLTHMDIDIDGILKRLDILGL